VRLGQHKLHFRSELHSCDLMRFPVQSRCHNRLYGLTQNKRAEVLNTGDSKKPCMVQVTRAQEANTRINNEGKRLFRYLHIVPINSQYSARSPLLCVSVGLPPTQPPCPAPYPAPGSPHDPSVIPVAADTVTRQVRTAQPPSCKHPLRTLPLDITMHATPHRITHDCLTCVLCYSRYDALSVHLMDSKDIVAMSSRRKEGG
jgi:hypothetical protein